MNRYSITMDLCGDYSRLIRHWLKKSGHEPTSTGTQLWYEYFNLHKKTVEPRNRKIYYAKEFSCPLEVQLGLSLLTEKIESGKSLGIHMSKGAHRPQVFDSLLYDWGIYHFHLGTEKEKHSSYIQRTGPVLFACFDDETAYLIGIYEHGKCAAKQPWAMRELLRIIHRNWPQLISRYRIANAAETSTKLTDEDYLHLRRSNISTAIELEKNAVYFSPGGGYMSSGHSMEIIRLCDNIWNTLKRYEIHIRQHVHQIVQETNRQSPYKIRHTLKLMLWQQEKSLYILEAQTRNALMEVTL